MREASRTPRRERVFRVPTCVHVSGKARTPREGPFANITQVMANGPDDVFDEGGGPEADSV